jgi:hypothetical protein
VSEAPLGKTQSRQSAPGPTLTEFILLFWNGRNEGCWISTYPAVWRASVDETDNYVSAGAL